jgi:hypothetical protein
MNPTSIELIGAGLFAVALLHTFSTKFFEHLARTRPTHAGLWHLLGEVEVVFGFWSLVLVLVMFSLQGKAAATHYLDTRNFTEPLFVFAIMVAAASKPVLQLAHALVHALRRLIPLPWHMASTLVVLSFVPLLGSFVTEPAAMTLAALLLRDGLYKRPISTRLKYATLGVLFVNVSIGGTLTPYADGRLRLGLGPHPHVDAVRLEGCVGRAHQRRGLDAAFCQRAAQPASRRAKA